MSHAMSREEQIALAEELQGMLLKEYKRRLETRTISGTGMASLQKLLKDNGWNLDPAHLKQELRDLLTTEVDPDELDDDDDVIDLARHMYG